MKTKLKLLFLGLFCFISLTSSVNALKFDALKEESHNPRPTHSSYKVCYMQQDSGNFRSVENSNNCDTHPSFKYKFQGAGCLNCSYKTSVPYLGRWGPSVHGFSYEKDGDGIAFWHSTVSNGVQVNKKFAIASRSAGYAYSGANFTDVFFWHHTYMLYDPNTRASVSFYGDLKLQNAFIVTNPDLKVDNVLMINLKAKKAWTTTLTGSLLRQNFVGEGMTLDFIKEMGWNKSYTLTEGGSNFFPWETSHFLKSQGLGLVYTEDLDFVEIPFKTPKTEEGESLTRPDETAFNQCVENWQNVKDLYYQHLKCKKGENPTSGPINEDGEILSTACSGYDAHTKYLQSKYKENWESFEKEFFLYVNGSHEFIDPIKKCGGGYKDETGVLEKISDYFYSGTKNLAGLVFNEKNVGYFNDFASWMTFGFLDFSDATDGITTTISDNLVNLGRGTEEIKDSKGNSVKVSEIYKDREALYDLKRKIEDPNISEEKRKTYQEVYNELALELSKKYGNYSSTGFVSSALGSGFKAGEFRDESSNIFKKYYNQIVSSYEKGRSALKFPRCQGGNFPAFNIFVHIFTLLIGFYIFKLFR